MLIIKFKVGAEDLFSNEELQKVIINLKTKVKIIVHFSY